MTSIIKYRFCELSLVPAENSILDNTVQVSVIGYQLFCVYLLPGIALTDSPIGLAAYILEKFSVWTNKDYSDLPDGGLTKHFTLDDLLTNIMIYWGTGSVTSSMRLYKESFSGEVLEKEPV